MGSLGHVPDPQADLTLVESASPEVTKTIEESSNHSTVGSVAHLSGWFAALVGLAYATGYLIVSTYLNSFGIEDASGDILRLRYLQVGFYFLIFLGSLVVLTTYLFRELFSQSEEGDSSPHISALSIPVWILFLLAIYMAVVFGEPSRTGRESLPWVASLVAVSFSVSTLLYWFRTKFSLRNPDFSIVNRVFYLLLLLIVGALGWKVTQPFEAKVKEFLVLEWEMVLILLVFMAALGWMFYRAAFRRPEMSARVHAQYMPLRAALGLPLYYLCVMTFAYGVYPFVSTSKAGGYYADSELIKLEVRTPGNDQTGIPVRRSDTDLTKAPWPKPHLSSRSVYTFQPQGEVLPPELMEAASESKPLVLIEENSDAIFVADPSEPANPPPGHFRGVKCWTDFECRPRVFEIQLLNLLRVEHIPQRK